MSIEDMGNDRPAQIGDVIFNREPHRRKVRPVPTARVARSLSQFLLVICKQGATPSNSKGKIYLKGRIMPLEVAKGCHKVFDLAG
jgi:hypothetical protein